MINSVENDVLSQLRGHTATLLEEGITDDNGLMSDLYEIGYLRQQVSGYLGAMAVQLGDDVEFFADSMPGERGLTTNGGAGFHYVSIHDRMIRSRDAMFRGMQSSYYTGLIVRVGSGLYYSDGSLLSLSQQMGRAVLDIESVLANTFQDQGITGEISPNELVTDEYNQNVDLATPSKVLRIAAKWKEKTLVPPYNPDTGERIAKVLSSAQALDGLTMEMHDLLLDGPPRRDIDIIYQVLKA